MAYLAGPVDAADFAAAGGIGRRAAQRASRTGRPIADHSFTASDAAHCFAESAAAVELPPADATQVTALNRTAAATGCVLQFACSTIATESSELASLGGAGVAGRKHIAVRLFVAGAFEPLVSPLRRSTRHRSGAACSRQRGRYRGQVTGLVTAGRGVQQPGADDADDVGLVVGAYNAGPDFAHWTDDRAAIRYCCQNELARCQWLGLSVYGSGADCCAQCGWFNPLVWLAWRRMQAERETACDDLVLRSGVQPATYAEQLLRIATQAASTRLSTFAVAIARPSTLENRVGAILDSSRNRRQFTRIAAAFAALLIAAVAVPLAIAASRPMETGLAALCARSPDRRRRNRLPRPVARLEHRNCRGWLIFGAGPNAESPAPNGRDCVEPMLRRRAVRRCG